MSLLGRLAGGVLGVARLPPLLPLRSLWTAVRPLPAPAVAPAAGLQSPVMAPLANGPLLATSTPQVVPSCGMKMRYALRRRCKHCYKVARGQRWYIMCPVHPRHKQMSLVPHPKTQWILSDVMQTPRRPW
ncbi:39S ribosomal protein L36, mitochondrial [Amphibalanus amphitrite]|uniref:Large ribosomal subunit protein bL36m n=1 Tax=Amphibalanus amphitrite TaxID=1232801 RepID=A0A6A4W7G9_AMPAM|nr:39S ribosomal protein L36, mitochondrial [Amphibalanus amphitrite]